MKYCQGPSCHTYHTKDRIRGHKGDKHYETRKQIYYFESFCQQRCYHDWFRKFGKLAIDHFGRIHEPKRTDASASWHKTCDWRHSSDGGSRYYFANDLLGERRPITEQQYDDENLTTPTN